ncbi:MAG: hypothetical protein CL927_05585 [Deltaproteobacteria bacterium]|nr:hypothetical protein [Deltaproteobacteria bacterium]
MQEFGGIVSEPRRQIRRATSPDGCVGATGCERGVFTSGEPRPGSGTAHCILFVSTQVECAMTCSSRLTSVLGPSRAKIPGTLLRPTPAWVKWFQDHMVSWGMRGSVRTTHGQHGAAACRQLGKAIERMAKRIPAPLSSQVLSASMS